MDSSVIGTVTLQEMGEGIWVLRLERRADVVYSIIPHFTNSSFVCSFFLPFFLSFNLRLLF